MLPHKYTEKTHTISYLIRHRDEFDVDRTYQREEVWPRKLKQYLIDTILKNLDIGRIWVRAEGQKHWIVDGQQRLYSIWEFANNEFPLNREFSGDLGGKFYRDLPKDIRDVFDEYNVSIVYLLGMTDAEIRDIFRRINSGIPLNTAERLNASPGDIVPTMRKLSQHPFFKDVCGLSELKRYRAYHIVAQIMLLQKNGITDISPRYLFDFFESQSNLNEKSSIIREIVNVLNYLEKALEKPTYELRKPSWIITIYLLTSYLLRNYVMKGAESRFKNFLSNFYNDVQKSIKTGDQELIDFHFAASRGTTSKDNIQKRHDIIFKRFWEYVGSLTPLDPEREFTSEERIAIFRKYGGKCAVCGEDLHRKVWHAHHKKPWIEGGPTTIENAELLCEKHHTERHKEMSV
ncbi:MAG: DUF262 domain-containing protein [Thermoproteota archaeon]